MWIHQIHQRHGAAIKPLRFPYGTGPGTPMGPHNGPRNKPVVLVVRVAACASSAPTGADGRRKTW